MSVGKIRGTRINTYKAKGYLHLLAILLMIIASTNYHKIVLFIIKKLFD